ncbi:MAG: superoxide dismutase [Fimbriimonadaceae bacterium]|nr:superoxide dismutase [Fimbriimonadaceae bacterium]
MPEYTLPPLPFAKDALEPHIDAKTMEIHHGKHHQAYVNNLNAALKDYPAVTELPVENLLVDLDVLPVPDATKAAVRNNGGGHANHTLFWDILTPGGSSAPSGALADKINETFGGLDQLKSQVNDAGAKRFGSGWAWLASDELGNLQVLSTANQDSPLSQNLVPLLGIDVWEHAYYLNYQNRRPDYLAAVWSVINWDKVAARYATVLAGR